MTRLLNIILPLSLFLTSFLSYRSLNAATFATLPRELDGSMMPYNFTGVNSSMTIPDSLTPCHISYVARHGARYLSSPKKIEKIEKELYKAAVEKRLTPEGDAFFSLLKQIADSTDGHWGLLSSVGIEEENRLGAEMINLVPSLLKKKGVKINSISTFVPRVIMTMYEFNHALDRHNNYLELHTSSGHQYDSLLYCFDTFSNYREFRDSGQWKEIYNDYVNHHVSPEPARRLFGKFLDNNKRRLRELTMEMYGVVQGCRAAGFEPPTTRWFSEEEYRQCYLASNLVHYLRNTPNAIDPWCAPATSRLIERIISDADRTLTEDPDEVFTGYFGHAETLLPLFATMNIPGCYYSTDRYDTLHEHWQLQDITPLGANLGFIFFRATSGEIYVATRLNGRNIPAYPGAPEIIAWSALKEYWHNRIKSLQRPKAKLL